MKGFYGTSASQVSCLCELGSMTNTDGGTHTPLLETEITRRRAARDPETCAFIYL